MLIKWYDEGWDDPRLVHGDAVPRVLWELVEGRRRRTVNLIQFVIVKIVKNNSQKLAESRRCRTVYLVQQICTWYTNDNKWPPGPGQCHIWGTSVKMRGMHLKVRGCEVADKWSHSTRLYKEIRWWYDCMLWWYDDDMMMLQWYGVISWWHDKITIMTGWFFMYLRRVWLLDTRRLLAGGTSGRL